MIERTVDAFSGDLANEWCPVTQREWFKPGTEPTKYCKGHTAPLLDQLEEFGHKLERAFRELMKLSRPR
jgi:hypothetical protein